MLLIVGQWTKCIGNMEKLCHNLLTNTCVLHLCIPNHISVTALTRFSIHCHHHQAALYNCKFTVGLGYTGLPDDGSNEC